MSSKSIARREKCVDFVTAGFILVRVWSLVTRLNCQCMLFWIANLVTLWSLNKNYGTLRLLLGKSFTINRPCSIAMLICWRVIYKHIQSTPNMPRPSKYSPKVVKVLELWSKTPFLWVGLPRQQETAKPESLLKTGGLSKYYQNHYFGFSF